MTSEQLGWLEKVNIIVKKWTIGKVIGEIQLSSFGLRLTVSLEPGECEDERDLEIIITDKWSLQPVSQKHSRKWLLPIFQRKREEYHHRNEHFIALCNMFGSPEITDAAIDGGGHLLLTFGDIATWCIDGAPSASDPEEFDGWKIIAGPYKLYSQGGTVPVGGFWDPYDLRDEINDNKEESQ